ncbi:MULTISPECIES: DUF2285 domain-containing protein [Xanthobacteraceae]|nr:MULTISPECIES: DUF2285 domain-containing protein [Xanthobacteraceae]MBS7538211.1 DUF2285 domain-containing protein [Ancylobacter lacus]
MPADLPLVLSELPGVAIHPAQNGVHIVWRVNGVDHQIWLELAVPSEPTGFVAILPLDALFLLRAQAARRLWRSLNGQPPDDPLGSLPTLTRDRHILTLRALDARLAGESYRTIAEVLLGFHGRIKNDWEVSPLKNQARRLVADGLYYMHGGYRDLLHYPLKLTRRR